MSRKLATVFALSTAIPAPAAAQAVYGPTDGDEVDEAVPITIMEERPCETEVAEDGAILVCRELEETERYLSPIPREVESDRPIIPGLTDPPCWVTNPEAVGTMACMRVGFAPEPAIMIDVSAFPEPLSAEDAALVVEVDADPDRESGPAIGERVAIDLDEDD